MGAISSDNPQKNSAFITVGQLPGFEGCFARDTLAQTVFTWFEEHPEIPGVIIREGEHYAMLTRSEMYECLGRPFGLEIFLHRPISIILKNNSYPPLILSEDVRIEEAVQMALARPVNQIYTPLIVQSKLRPPRLIDFHQLLMAQTQLLVQTNRFIHQQVETERTLSNLFEVEQILKQILLDLNTLVPYHYGVILVFNPSNFQGKTQYRHTNWPDSAAGMDPTANPKILNRLITARQPMLIDTFGQTEYTYLDVQGYHIHSWIGAPLIYSDQLVGILSLCRMTHGGAQAAEALEPMGPFTALDLEHVVSLSNTFTSAIRNAQLMQELRLKAVTDPLTGVLNRRGFFERASGAKMAALPNREQSLLILDIDYFKRINDHFGHLAGDQVIQEVASLCQGSLRQGDLLGRYGGEEFVVLLPDTNRPRAEAAADRLREQIAHHRMNINNQTIYITVSIGGATFYADTEGIDLHLQRADEALYHAKIQGRNRVAMWQPGFSQLEIQNIQDSLSALHTNTLAAPTDSLVSDLTLIPQNLLRKEEIENESILGLVQALEMREKEARGHAQRVAEITLQLARKAHLPEDQLATIYRGALLHDIGKIAIPDQILFKPGKLTANEWETMRLHPIYAYQLLSSLPYLKDAAEIPYCHHEKWNGSGYPRGLKGAEIPIAARLFAIVDVWDALTSDRCYRPAWKQDQVISHIQDQSGRHFDPDLVDLFLDNLSVVTA